MVNKTALTILISIILTAIIVSLVNVGTSLFLNEPEYDQFCDYSKPTIDYYDENITKEICEANNATWISQPIKCVQEPCPQGYCDPYYSCQKEYENAQKPYNQYRFYIFATIGFILLILGLFIAENLVQITGLATGGILVFQSIIFNLQNKLAVFLTLLGILVIFGILAYRVINSKK